jgi:hypothetical protein
MASPRPAKAVWGNPVHRHRARGPPSDCIASSRDHKAVPDWLLGQKGAGSPGQSGSTSQPRVGRVHACLSDIPERQSHGGTFTELRRPIKVPSAPHQTRVAPDRDRQRHTCRIGGGTVQIPRASHTTGVQLAIPPQQLWQTAQKTAEETWSEDPWAGTGGYVVTVRTARQPQKNRTRTARGPRGARSGLEIGWDVGDRPNEDHLPQALDGCPGERPRHPGVSATKDRIGGPVGMVVSAAARSSSATY